MGRRTKCVGQTQPEWRDCLGWLPCRFLALSYFTDFQQSERGDDPDFQKIHPEPSRVSCQPPDLGNNANFLLLFFLRQVGARSSSKACCKVKAKAKNKQRKRSKRSSCAPHETFWIALFASEIWVNRPRCSDQPQASSCSSKMPWRFPFCCRHNFCERFAILLL